MCYTIGFGISKDDKLATSILRDHSLENTDLQYQIRLIMDGKQETLYNVELFLELEFQGIAQYIDSPQHYRGKK